MNIRWRTVVASITVGVALSSTAVDAVGQQTTQNQTKGTAQMAGGQGQFGVTYTLVSTDGFGPVNFTLVSANYSVARVCVKPGQNFIPQSSQKLLVIHYKLKNPNKTDMYYSSRSLFQAVDANNNLIEDCGESRQESDSKEDVGATMKPGQGLDDLYTCIVVPAKGSIGKLILKLARPGTKDTVTRYMLSTKPNVVKPLSTPYADPTDKTGATALEAVPCAIGTPYTVGQLDIGVSSVALVPGPLGSLAADDGKQFLVATLTATNRTTVAYGFDGSLSYTLKTDDGKLTDFTVLKAKSDDRSETQSLDPGESGTVRVAFQIPKGAALKTFSLAEPVDTGFTRAFVYDLSSVK